jgi:hypothetical protein
MEVLRLSPSVVLILLLLRVRLSGFNTDGVGSAVMETDRALDSPAVNSSVILSVEDAFNPARNPDCSSNVDVFCGAKRALVTMLE